MLVALLITLLTFIEHISSKLSSNIFKPMFNNIYIDSYNLPSFDVVYERRNLFNTTAYQLHPSRVLILAAFLRFNSRINAL